MEPTDKELDEIEAEEEFAGRIPWWERPFSHSYLEDEEEFGGRISDEDLKALIQGKLVW